MLAKFRGGAKASAGLPLQPKGATPLLVELLGPGELFKLSFADQAALCERLAPGAAKVARKPSAMRAAMGEVVAALRWALAQIEDDLHPDHQAALASCHNALRMAGA